MRKFPKSWTGWLLGLMGLALMAGPGFRHAHLHKQLFI